MRPKTSDLYFRTLEYELKYLGSLQSLFCVTYEQQLYSDFYMLSIILAERVTFNFCRRLDRYGTPNRNNLYYKMTSLNPQNLRNIIKKVAKISIIQILLLMSNLSVKTTVFSYFLQLFRYPTNFAPLR